MRPHEVISTIALGKYNSENIREEFQLVMN